MTTLIHRPHRITIEQRSTSVDSFQGQSTAYTTLGVFWAAIRQLSGRELEAAQAQHAAVTHEIRMLYDSRINAKQRIRFRGRYFDILSAWNVDEAGVETRIAAVEGLAIV